MDFQSLLTNGSITSRKVAEILEVDHEQILRDIGDASDDVKSKNFIPTTYQNEYGKPMPEFIVTRDGFTFLFLGCETPVANALKTLFFAAYNQGRSALANQGVDVPSLTDIFNPVNNRQRQKDNLH